MNGKLFTLTEQDQELRGFENTESDLDSVPIIVEEKKGTRMSKDYGRGICIEPDCQKEFTRTSGNQKRCPDCSNKKIYTYEKKETTLISPKVEASQNVLKNVGESLLALSGNCPVSIVLERIKLTFERI